LVPHLGYCEYECNLCGQVCPTQAIESLALADKQKVKMGLAYFDTQRCLPYAYQRECMICEEHCPLPTKAIHFVPTEVVRRDGTKVTVKQPRVDPDLCIGCGICEAKCVFRDRAAVRVSSANESRHSSNQPILPSLPGAAPVAPPTPAAGNSNPYG
jgi:formate hydrogenlyase subunit 6/NADH:ubiquinone oxidoreductase subunit I